MARPNPIRAIMEAPLPSLTYQRRLSFRPSYAEVNYIYNKLNFYLFDNRLRKPVITQGSRRKTWGFCEWEHQLQDTGSYTTISIMDKWFTPCWFVQTLAHEMVHQYQWDIDRFESGREYKHESGCHGPSFFDHRERFDYYGLRLKTSYGMKRWFKYQDWYKC
jgi:hypothetical protein